MVLHRSGVQGFLDSAERTLVVDHLRIQVECLNQIAMTLEPDGCCISAIKHIQMVYASLHNIKAHLLNTYLEVCVASTLGDGDQDAVLNEISVTFRYRDVFCE